MAGENTDEKAATLREAAQIVAETREENAAAEVAEEIASDVIEAAAERVEAAEKTAQQITDAALMTELGRRVDALQEEFYKLRGEIDEWRNQILSQLRADFAPALERINLMLEMINSEQEQQETAQIVASEVAEQLTPPQSEEMTPPKASSQNSEESEAPTRRSQKRFL